MYEDGDSFRRHVDLKRYGVNPTVGVPGRAEHAHRPRLRIFPRPPHRRPRRSGATARRAARRASTATSSAIPTTASPRPTSMSRTFAVEHELRRRPDAHATARRSPTTTNSTRTSIRTARSTRRRASVTLGAYNSRNDRQNLFSQTDLIWENRLGGIDQTLLFGFEVGRQKSRNQRHDRAPSSTATTTPLTDPTVDKRRVLRVLRERRQQPHPGDRRRGLRPGPDPPDRLARDRRRPAVRQLQAGRRTTCARRATDFSRRDELWSPRLGLILKPRDNLSIYTSYQPLLSAAIGRPVQRPHLDDRRR